MFESQAEYHDLAVARQQAASIMVSGGIPSIDVVNDVVVHKMSFRECETESIELTIISSEDSTATTESMEDNNVASKPSLTTDTTVTELNGDASAKYHSDHSLGNEPTIPLSTKTTLTIPLAPDVTKDYYNVITSSAMMGSVPRLFSSDAANNYYHAMTTRSLLKDDSFKKRGGSNRSNWSFGRKKINDDNTTTKDDKGVEEKNHANDKAVDDYDASAVSVTKSVETLKKLVTDKIFVTKSIDSYERLNEEVTVEAVSESSECDSSDSTILSGNSSHSMHYSELNNVREVVTDTNENVSHRQSETILSMIITLDDLLANAVASSITPEDVAKYILDRETVLIASNNQVVRVGSLDEMLLAQAVVSSTTPEDVARNLLDNNFGSSIQKETKDHVDEDDMSLASNTFETRTDSNLLPMKSGSFRSMSPGATISPIPSSPNDTSPIFYRSPTEVGDEKMVDRQDQQNGCVIPSAITKCVSFEKQVIERDEVKQMSKTMKALSLPPLVPHRSQKKTFTETKYYTKGSMRKSPEEEEENGSVECSVVNDDCMALKSAPSYGGCSIKTEYVNDCNNDMPSNRIPNNSHVNSNELGTNEGVVDSSSSMIVASTNATSGTTSLCAQTTTSTVLLPQQGKKLNDMNHVVNNPDKEELFCIPSKVMAEEIKSNLKVVQQKLFSFLLQNSNGKNVMNSSSATASVIGKSTNGKTKGNEDHDGDESVISWSQLNHP